MGKCEDGSTEMEGVGSTQGKALLPLSSRMGLVGMKAGRCLMDQIF